MIFEIIYHGVQNILYLKNSLFWNVNMQPNGFLILNKACRLIKIPCLFALFNNNSYKTISKVKGIVTPIDEEIITRTIPSCFYTYSPII